MKRPRRLDDVLAMTQDVAPDAPAAVLPSTCTLYLGDCLSVTPKIEAGSVAMVFADLPYGTTAAKYDTEKVDIDKFWKIIMPPCTRNAAIVLSATLPFGIDVIQSNRKLFRYDMIFQKCKPSRFLQANKMPMRGHENLFVFYRFLPTYNPQMTDAGKPSNRYSTRRGDISSEVNGIYGAYMGIAQRKGTQRLPTTVLSKFSVPSNTTLHPAQKPVDLLEWLIKTYTNPGDTVLDPVFGSCTTGVACARLGRHFIGIEKDPEYFRVGRERVDAERAKLGLKPCEVNQ